jgi:ATP-dependent 26S proteasome regulatory subunit
VNEKIGVKESDTGLAPPHLWDVAADRQRMSEEQPLQVARCTKIIQDEKDTEKSKYVINVKQIAKFVVNLGERVSPTDIEEGMRVGQAILEPLSNFIADLRPVSTETSTKSCYLSHQRSMPALR